MTVLAKPTTRQGALILGKNLLNQAGLEKQVRIIVQQGEIRIVAMPASDPEVLLAELAGCLGQEPASEYDFKSRARQGLQKSFGIWADRDDLNRDSIVIVNELRCEWRCLC